MLELIKKRCGIAAAVTVYDEEITSYIADAKSDMRLSGVDASLLEAETDSVVTAIAFYIKANLGNDRSDTEKYMDLYHKKVFRLTMEDSIEKEETCGTNPSS